MTYHCLGMQQQSMLGHYFLCVEIKTDKIRKRTKKYTTTCKFLDFMLSAKQKNISSHTTMSPELNLEVLQGCVLWQLPLSLPLCMSLYMHMPLHPCAPLWFKLLPLCISFPRTPDPAASILHSLFSVTIWISLSPCAAILNPKTLHHQSPGLGLPLFPDTSTFSLPFHPTFHYPKSQNNSKILPPICTDIETGIRTAHFLFMLGACTWLFLPTLPYLPFEDEVICSHHLN